MKINADRSVMFRGLATVLAWWLLGCSSPPVAYRIPDMPPWPSDDGRRPTAAPVRTAAPEPTATELHAPPEVAHVAAERSLPEQTVSDMDLAETTDIATVLRALAKAAGVNIMVSPNVSGDISFALQDVPWDQAFRSVVASAGLTYMWEGDVLRVLTIEDVRAELDMETARKERERVRAELRLVEPLVMQVYRIRYARADGLGDLLRSLLAGQVGDRQDFLLSRAYVTVNEETNAIVLHATRDDQQKAQALIRELDRPRPQVHIEARIVEATRDTARQLGVQWGGYVAAVRGERLWTAGGPGVTADGFISDFPGQFAQGGVAPAGFSLGLLTEKFGGSDILNMQLTALQRAGRIQILSSPSITTLDNERAVIESGEERAYRVTTGTGNILDVSLEWKKAVLKLEVTPQVIDDNTLRIEIVANKDTFDETRPQTNNEFPVNTKHARTTVLLMDGQTVVIGGLSQESNSDTRTGVPYLMNLPLIGSLFRNSNRAIKFDDTLIFITPRILTPEEDAAPGAREG